MSRRAKILLGSAAAGVVLLLAVGGLFVPLDAALRLDAGAIGAGPSMTHPLGGDALGRDELARFLVGARTTLGIGLVATLIAFAIGAPLGWWAARSRWGRVAVTAASRLLFVAPTALLSARWWGRCIVAVGCATLVLPTAFLALVVVVVAGPGMATSAVTIGLLFAAAPTYAAADPVLGLDAARPRLAVLAVGGWAGACGGGSPYPRGRSRIR
jgi:peptide/nickel transport system permease protein